MNKTIYKYNPRVIPLISSLDDITQETISKMISGKNSICQPSFGMAISSFMSEAHITVEQLAEQTHLSSKTIQRIRNKPCFRFDHKTVIALCVGLHLDSYDSRILLQLAGLTLNGSERDRVYQIILNFAFQESVDSCNKLLLRLGMEPLTETKY